jgi:hypothetical protein
MKHGIVTSKEIVEEGHLVLTIQSSRAGVTWPNVPVAQDHPGDIQNIEEGWHVALAECDDGLWICVGVLNSDPSKIPNTLDESERSIKFDDGTEISARKNGNGNYDVTISASGDVYLGDEGNATKVAKQNHTHDYSWTDSGGSGSTGSPNESGTNTQIE